MAASNDGARTRMTSSEAVLWCDSNWTQRTCGHPTSRPVFDINGNRHWLHKPSDDEAAVGRTEAAVGPFDETVGPFSPLSPVGRHDPCGNKTRCFIDMDGVLVDFVGPACAIHGKPIPDPWPTGPQGPHWDFFRSWGITQDEFWEKLDRSFWENLPLTREADAIIRCCVEAFGRGNVYLLTSPSRNPDAAAGKVAWVARNMPEFSGRLLIGECKHAAAGGNAVLVDDSSKNIDAFVRAGGWGVTIGRPWNGLPTPADIGSHLRSKFADITVGISMRSLPGGCSAENGKPSNPKDIIGSDKVPLSLVPGSLKTFAALAYLEGMLKYGLVNWREVGVMASVYLDAIERHLECYKNGEWSDPETKVPHLASIVACCGIILDAKLCGKLTDDRPKQAPVGDLIRSSAETVKHLKSIFAGRSPVHYTFEGNEGNGVA